MEMKWKLGWGGGGEGRVHKETEGYAGITFFQIGFWQPQHPQIKGPMTIERLLKGPYDTGWGYQSLGVSGLDY